MSQLYVVNIAAHYTNDTFKAIFSKYGDVLDVKICKPKGGRDTKFGFITYGSKEEADLAVSSSTKDIPDMKVTHSIKTPQVPMEQDDFLPHSRNAENMSCDKPPPLLAIKQQNELVIKPMYTRSLSTVPDVYKESKHSEPIIAYPATPSISSCASEADFVARSVIHSCSRSLKHIEIMGNNITIHVTNISSANNRTGLFSKSLAMGTTKVEPCVVCDSRAFFCCPGCSSVIYCSVNCQIMDYTENNHRNECFEIRGFAHQPPSQPRITPGAKTCITGPLHFQGQDPKSTTKPRCIIPLAEELQPQREPQTELQEVKAPKGPRFNHNEQFDDRPLRKPHNLLELQKSLFDGQNMENPTAKTINMINNLQSLKAGDKVLSCFGNDPYQFYVQKFSEGNELKAISDILLNAKQVSGSPRVFPKCICLAKYVDGLWYRARIDQVLDNEQCTVFFLDFGNTETINIANLCDLPQELLKYSPKAYCLWLLNIKPPNKACEFSDQLKSRFFQFISSKSFVVVKATLINEALFHVELRDEEGNDLAKILIKEHLADPVSKFLIKQTTPPKPATDFVREKPIILTEQTLKSGDIVTLVFGDDPSKFYLCKESDMDEATSIDEKLKILSSESSQPFSGPPGSICLAKFEDGQWYRAKIQKCKKEEFEVFFFDYGNVGIISAADLRTLPSSISFSPKAFQCRLDLVKPQSESGYDVKAKEYFLSLLTGKTVSVKKVAKNQDYFVVDLVSKKNENISELLISSGTVQSLGLKTPPANNIAHTPLDSRTVNKRILELTPVKNNGVSSDSSNINCLSVALLPTQSIVPGEKVALCYGTDPLCFYTQKITTDVVAMSEKLQARMNEAALTSALALVPGAVCASKYVDGLWYRTKIEKVLEDAKCHIFFIDFGNEEISDPSALACLPEEFLSYPAMAYCLRLNCKPVNGDAEFSEEVKALYVQLIQGEPLTVTKSIPNEGGFSVQLKDRDDNDLVDLLSTYQYAEYISLDDQTTVLTKTNQNSSSSNISSVTGLMNILTGTQSSKDDSPNHLNLVPPIISKTNVASNRVDSKYTDCPSFDELPKQTLSVDDKVVHCYGSDPHCFYVQKFNDEEVLQIAKILEAEMNKNVAPLLNPVVGSLCVAKYEDNSWYRARIEKVLDNGECEVFFIDYGNNEVAHSSTVAWLPKDLMSLTPKAFCLRLNIKPLQGATEFSEEVKNAYVAYIKGECLTVKKSKLNNGVFCVELKDSEESDIADALSASEVAEKIVLDLEEIEVPILNTIEQSSESSKISAVQQMQVSNQAAPSNLSQVSMATLENSYSLKDTKLPDSISYDKMPKQSLSINDTVILSFGSDPMCFYVQKQDDKELQLISKTLEMKMSKNQATNYLLKPVIGTVCAAKFEDNSWYRAKIEKVLESNKCEIFFLDFGNTEIAANSSLAGLPDELISYPPKAYCLRLNVKPLEGAAAFSEEIKNVFIQYIQGEPLTVTKLVPSDNIYAVMLKDSDEGDIAQALSNNHLMESSVLEFEVNVSNVGNAVIGTKPKEATPIILLPQQKLCVNDKIVLCYGDDPLSFYVQKQDDVELTTISRILDTKMREEPLTLVSKPAALTICAAKYMDNSWYRAKIEKMIEKDQCEVFFIDYGNTEIADCSTLAKLPEELLSYSAKTFHLRLNVNPLKDAKEFSDEIKTTFVQFIQGEPLTVTKLVHLDGVYTVELKDRDDGDIAQILSLNHLAVSYVVEVGHVADVESVMVLPIPPQKLEFNEKLCLDVHESIDAEPNKDEISTPAPSNDENQRSQIIPVSAKDTLPVKSLAHNVPVQETIVKSKFTEDRPSSLPQNVLKVGDEEYVVVVVTTGSEIYVQKELEAEKLSHFVSQLGKFSDRTRGNQDLPHVGDFASAFFMEEWCRVKVLSQPKEGSFEVFFVDYGNTAVVSAKDIVPLPKKAFSFPPFAYCVCLKDVLHISNEACALLLNERLMMKVMSTDLTLLSKNAKASVTLKSDSEIKNKMIRSEINIQKTSAVNTQIEIVPLAHKPYMDSQPIPEIASTKDAEILEMKRKIRELEEKLGQKNCK